MDYILMNCAVQGLKYRMYLTFPRALRYLK
ncbi:hypothetical protein SAMN05216366_15321 [Selenomonas ruminantium]|uniref:Uncharacterized protein n=1 Tax=Selenomonas ruminantium TaxID=971 RepID=A0A1H0VFR1_SELRU|nr:hypothetical protein SAMN05216366_15321 [Selenomonas ruminantium]